MGSLKELRQRIKSIKSTQKITAAMKMVAAAKLRKSQEKVALTKPYVEKIYQMISHLVSGDFEMEVPSLLETGRDGAELIIVMSSEKGLCGSYNSLILKEARQFIKRKTEKGELFYLLVMGRRGLDSLKKEHPENILTIEKDESKSNYAFAQSLTNQIIKWLEVGKIGKVSIVGSVFKSILVQETQSRTLIPFQSPEKNHSPYIIIEPEAEILFPELLEKNLIMEIYSTMIESVACEQAARMTAMDNATRNAREMIQKLQLVYNQTRQAHITNELIEIISGAQAL
ncbi:MAG: ATP synthase F1 subunit gamma [Alphaproteobacteria bacterium]|nr:ATP synthase F1 subunit gamma [Alphaproteobacteria bacterium]